MDTIKTIEEWRYIEGSSLCYQVSNYGNIKALPRMVGHNYGGLKVKSEVILKPITKSTGYLMVNISIGRERSAKLIHRMVALAFIDNPEKKPCVNHKNGVKSDNRAENLEWCTYSENEKHSYRVLNKISPRLKCKN